MSTLSQSPQTSFISRVVNRNGQSGGTIKGEVISDTHIGAPYADPIMTERFFEEKLAPQNHVSFCVLLGDMFEMVNLAVKGLPETEDEARALRAKKIRNYVEERVPVKSPRINDMLKRLPDVAEEDVNRILGFHRMVDGQVQLINPKGESDIRTIFRKTRVRQDVETEMIGRHMTDLANLVNQHPGCTFYYVIGNHERMPEFLRAVEQVSQELKEKAGGKDRLIVTQEYLRMGDALFMHGDQQMSPDIYTSEEGPKKYAESYKESTRHRLLQVAHDKLNKWIPLVVGELLHRPEQCARKVIGWLNENDPKALEGVRHIFMGHTHFPFTDVTIMDGRMLDGTHVIYQPSSRKKNRSEPEFVSKREYRFHNTGAALERLPRFNQKAFNPIEIVLQPPAVPVSGADPLTYYAGYTATLPLQQLGLQRACLTG